MARIRSIKPEFFTSLTIGDLPPLARLTFIGLWTYVDDDGRGVDDVRLIRSAIWPLDDRTFNDIEQDLVALEQAGVIIRYVGPCHPPESLRNASGGAPEPLRNPSGGAPEREGRKYLAVTNWKEHQRISHPRATRYPEPNSGYRNGLDDTSESLRNASGGAPEPLRNASGAAPETSGGPPSRARARAAAEQGAGSREQGKEQGAVSRDGNAREDSHSTAQVASLPVGSNATPPHPLPAEWEPTAEHHATAEELGLDCPRVAQKFASHMRGHGKLAVDWNAKFTEWLLRERPGTSQPSHIDSGDGWDPAKETYI
jgi:hypothetical protein